MMKTSLILNQGLNYPDIEDKGTSQKHFFSIQQLRDLARVLLIVLLPLLNLTAQRIHLSDQVEVSPPLGGWYPWYEVQADPINPANLIVCGSVGNGKRNTLHGFVYASWDGGKTWHASFEDRASAWVSEQSCAFGRKKAYFVSESTKIIDGVKHTDSGITRIFVSDDAGRTWHYRASTRWADYSSSVVDINSGRTENRLYTFFNSPATAAVPGAEGSRVGVLTVGYADKKVPNPIFNSGPDSDGAFPEKAFALNDGSVLALYWGGLKSANSPEIFFAAIRLSPDGRSLSAPVIIAHSLVDTDDGCYGYAEAYDSSASRIFAAYHERSAGKCAFLLRTSVDDGQTWSPPTQVATEDGVDHLFATPAMAVNPSGVLGLIWREGRGSDCWYFSDISGSKTKFSAPVPLSQCPTVLSSDVTISTSFLVSEIAGSKIRVANMSGEIWRNSGSLTAARDGTFHAVWSESGGGKGQLRTAKIEVGGSDEGRLFSLPAEPMDTHNINGAVTLLFGGSQGYDSSSGTLSIAVSLKNKGHEPIKVPVYLKALTLSGGIGKLEILNADNGVAGPGAVWNISPVIPGGLLLPGKTTKPYRLSLRVTPKSLRSEPQVELVTMELNVLAR